MSMHVENQRLPTTDGKRRRRHAKPVKPPTPFAPTVQQVKEIVPQKIIPQFKPRIGDGRQSLIPAISCCPAAATR